MILKIFLIFGDLSLDDSYKINSCKKKCVMVSNWPRGPRSKDIQKNWSEYDSASGRIPQKPKIPHDIDSTESWRIPWNPQVS